MKSCVFGSIFTLLINMFLYRSPHIDNIVRRDTGPVAVVLSTPATSRQTISSLLHISTVPTTFNLDQNLSAIGLLVFLAEFSKIFFAFSYIFPHDYINQKLGLVPKARKTNLRRLNDVSVSGLEQVGCQAVELQQLNIFLRSSYAFSSQSYAAATRYHLSEQQLSVCMFYDVLQT